MQKKLADTSHLLFSAHLYYIYASCYHYMLFNVQLLNYSIERILCVSIILQIFLLP